MGMVDLSDDLVTHGVTNSTGWRLQDAVGVSGDGHKMVGVGINPVGNTEAFLATIPELNTYALGLIGLLCLRFFALQKKLRRV